MFEKLLRELKALQETKIQIPIKLDREGYIDKECPNKKCLYHFKVYGDDWKNIFKDKAVYCPMCRHEAPANQWFTTAQIQDSREQAIKHVQGRFSRALREGARDFNARQPRNSFLKFSVKYSGGAAEHYFVPLAASKVMERKVNCQCCNARYAVIGSAFFCPSCGHNSIEETFDNSMSKIEAKMDNLETIRDTIMNKSADDAEITVRSLIESSINEGVVAFQFYCESRFSKLFPNVPVKFNTFQSLQRGGEYWKKQIGESYEDWLSSKEFKQLAILFQKRHVLCHREGIVDQKYIARSGDKTYTVGQRIVVTKADVRLIVSLVSKVVDKLKQIN